VGAHRAELELSDARTPRAELELCGAHHRAELELSDAGAPLGPRWSCPTRAPTGPSWSCPTRAPLGPSWSAPRWCPSGRGGAVRRRAHPSGRAEAVRRARHRAELELIGVGAHRAELELSDARPGPSWARRPWLPPWSAPPGRAGAVRRAGLHRAELELSDARPRAELDAATMAAVLARTTGPSWSCPTRVHGPSWTRRPWLPSWRAPRGRAGAVRHGRHRPELGAATMARRCHSRRRSRRAPRCRFGRAPRAILAGFHRGRAGRRTMAARCQFRRHSERAARCQFRRRSGKAPRFPSWARRWSPSWSTPGRAGRGDDWRRAANSAAVAAGRRAARAGRGDFGAGLPLARCSTFPRRSAPPA